MYKRVGIVGATGNVGYKAIEMILETKLTTYQNITLFASLKSVGNTVNVGGNSFLVEAPSAEKFNNMDIVLFNTESDVSAELVPQALQGGAYVVDSSSHYRLHPNVPLIVPPVNAHLITHKHKLYSHANCLASPISLVVHPLHAHNPIKRITAVTYQSTSGAGKAALSECWNETAAAISGEQYSRTCFPRQIAFNVIPQVGDIMDDGMTYEEHKIIHEIKKVVDQNIKITTTAVRVPVLVGHSVALNIEFSKAFEITKIVEALEEAKAVKLSEHNYSTPAEVEGKNDVFIGRIRRDPSLKHGLNLWLCSDNLRRGAAADAVEILQAIAQL